MAFVRPTLGQIVDRVQQDFISRLSFAGSILRRSLVYVLTRVLAGCTHMLYGALDYYSRQMLPDTMAITNLPRWGTLFGLTPNGATFAQGNIALTGTSGTDVPAGSILTRQTDAAEFTTDVDATVPATVSCTAAIAGSASTLSTGDQLDFTSPITGADATVSVSASTTDGEDAEDLDTTFRTRVLERMQNPPTGGSDADYEDWTLSVPGVGLVWVHPQQLGAGSVVVYFMMVNADGTFSIPNSTQVTSVQTALNAERPATATPTAIAPTANPVNYTIHLIPSNATTQASVTAELTDLHQRNFNPGATFIYSKIETAIGDAMEEYDPVNGDFTLTLPASSPTNSTGQISTLGTITWT